MRSIVSAVLTLGVVAGSLAFAAPASAAHCDDAVVHRLSAEQPHWKPNDEPSHRRAMQLAQAANACRAAHEHDSSAIGYALRAAAAYASAAISATTDDDRRAAQRAGASINRGVKNVDNSLRKH